MRTIKASEVAKGMRVRVEAQQGGATVTSEGVVTRKGGEYTALIWFGDHCVTLHPDHPVTVLAEPEPEWVEGAWYWVELTSEPRRPLKRLAGGWTCYDDDRAWFSDDSYPDITVLGRVPIVDWPGDDVARELAQPHPLMSARNVSLKAGIEAVADAIRTQGGAR